MSTSAALGVRTTGEIATQPDCWTRAIEIAADEAAKLPRPGERVLVIGCGTSFFIAQAYAALREAAGHGETDALVASEVPVRPRPYDRIVALSRSGTSAEVVTAVERLAANTPVTAVVGVTDTPVATAARDVVHLGFADEESVVQTRFATSALTLLRAAVDGDLRGLVPDGVRALTSGLPPVPERQLVVLATGWAVGLAQEGALKCRESAAAWVEAYPAGEYRHGPIAVADHRTLVWAMTPLPDIQSTAVMATGAALEQGRLDPMAELVRLQRFAVLWAQARGRDADSPTNLTRSVTEA
jgi:glutamine---fructose-6-phosphate transaminase (isomerizing)